MARAKEKLIASCIYIIIWIILILAQAMMLNDNYYEHSFFWQNPEKYYAVWIADIVMIISYYCNYYVLAPYFVRNRAFFAYSFWMLILSFLVMLSPYIINLFFGNYLIGSKESKYPVYTELFLESLVLLIFGLSSKAIQQWNQVSIRLQEREKELVEKDEKIRLLLEQKDPHNSLIKNDKPIF